MISQSQVDEIIEKNEIAEVISAYTRLERKGSGYMGLCPFHKEKTPSFSVHDGKQIFKCFGCGKGGNVVHFIMLAEGLDYVGALRFLADRAGIVIQDTWEKKQDGKEKRKQDILSLNKSAARFFYNQLKVNETACQYFIGRGISAATVKKFGLGYAPAQWTSLTEHFTKQGVSAELLLAAGLAQQKKSSEGEQQVKVYDKFRNRVMFPIFDVMGNVIAFGGRVLDDSQPKYLNSPETDAYSKGKHLYGLNFARKAESRRVIMVEGYMDCIALHQKGIPWAVASLGTALTNQQARLLKKYFDEVIIGYDADAAGQAATLRGLDILAACGFRVKVLSIPGAKDPDEFLKKHSAEEFLGLVDQAQTLVEYKIRQTEKQWSPNKLDTRVEFLKRVTSILASIESAVEQDMYINWVSGEYDIAREPLLEQVRRVQAGQGLQPQHVVIRQRPIRTAVDSESETGKHDSSLSEDSESRDKLDRQEKLLLLLLSEDSPCLRKVKAEISPDFFTGKENRRLYESLLDRQEQGQRMGAEALLADAKEQRDAEVFSRILQEWLTPSDSYRACREVIKKCKKAKFDSKITEIYGLLQNPKLDSEEKKVLTKELNDILLEKRTGL